MKLFAVLLLSSTLFGQVLYKNAHSVGFGLTSPRWFSDAYAEWMNYGAHVYYQYDFDEVNAIRVKADYMHFTSKQAFFDAASIAARIPGSQATSSNVFNISAAYLYTFAPCSKMKMYFGPGFSVVNYTLKDAISINIPSDKWQFGELGVDFLVGTRYALSPEWDVRGEFGYHTTSTDKFDGVYGNNGGLFGGVLDSYATLELGFQYYFSHGDLTHYCDMPTGMSEESRFPTFNVDYAKLEDAMNKAVKNNTPAPEKVDYARIGDMFDKKLKDYFTAQKPGQAPGQMAAEAKPVLVGINFNFNDATILPENFIILSQDAAVLLAHPDLKVEICGHTDNIGRDGYNQKLSEQRAKNVMDFLLAKGVPASQMKIAGFSFKNAVSTNDTDFGRHLNRRVEFNVVK